MRFDQINIIDITTELVELRHNKLDTTIIIGQLNLDALQLLLNVIKDIPHVHTITFEATSINNTNIELVAFYIKDHMINYEILYEGEFQKCFLSIFVLTMQLEQSIAEIPNGFRINRCPPKILSFDRQTEAPKTIPEHTTNLKLKNVPEKRPITKSNNEAVKYPKISCLKHRQNIAAVSSSHSSPLKKVQFADNEKDSFISKAEDIEIVKYTKITHAKCGSADELHRLISFGQDDEARQYLEKLSVENKQNLLTSYCAEEEFFGASILRLALRTNHIVLMDILLKEGVDPFHCSQDGNTLLHDIVLDIKPTALRILLKHISSTTKLQQLVNLPFHGQTYNGYFALDIICVEASLHFNKFKQTLGERLANNIYSIMQILLNNNAQSKLINDSKNQIKAQLLIDIKGMYSKEGLWNIISAIAEEHEILTSPISQIKYHSLNEDKLCAIKFLAKIWQTNGILPAPITKKPSDIKTYSAYLPMKNS